MKISVRSRYGLKAMVDLAINSISGPVTIKQIAERQNISERYLEQVFSLLKKNGFINSIKGPHGGYSLNVKPSDITVERLLQALEGNLLFSESQECIDFLDKCIIDMIWKRIDNNVLEIIQKVTLLQLVEEYKKESDVSANMYYI
jgi:Rrf2 family protein